MSAVATFPVQRASAADLFFKLAMAVSICVVGLEIGYLLYSPMPYDMLGYMVGRDFVNTWVGAKLALSGDPGAHFGIQTYTKLLAETFYPGYPFHLWSYPPHILLFIWPWAFLPYMSGYVLYCAAGLVLYVAVVRDGERRASHLLLLALSPAVILNIWAGQNGFVTSVLLFGGLLQLDRRPVLAGVLFGLLTIKPQLGLLLPVVLVLTRQWRTIAAAIVTALVLIATTTAIYGTSVWTAYWYNAMPTQSRVVLEGYSSYMAHMPTAFMNAKVAGLPLVAAFGIQGVVSVLTLVAVGWTFWRRRDRDLSLALLLAATFTVTPYAFNYDMPLLSAVIVRLMDREDNEQLDYALMLAVWAVPFLTVPLGMAGIPLSFAALFAFGARLAWRLWKAERQVKVDRSLAFRPAG